MPVDETNLTTKQSTAELVFPCFCNFIFLSKYKINYDNCVRVVFTPAPTVTVNSAAGNVPEVYKQREERHSEQSPPNLHMEY